MKRLFKLSRACLGLALLAALAVPAHAGLRGYNYTQADTATKAKYQEMKNSGAKLVRIAFANQPLGTYDRQRDRLTMSQTNLGHLRRNVEYAQQVGLRVVIDPHTMFGSTNRYTLTGRSPFWLDVKYGNAYAKMWGEIAKVTKDYGDVIWALDLINEPSNLNYRQKEFSPPQTVVKVEDVYAKCMQEIRKHDRRHPMYVMHDVWDYHFNAVKLPNWYADRLGDPAVAGKILYQTHFYSPSGFTLQGERGGDGPGLKWPFVNGNGDLVTGASIDNEMARFTRWLDRNNIPRSKFYVGEWGVTYGNDRAWENGGPEWMKRVYANMEASGYSWTIHTWEGNSSYVNVKIPNARYTLVKKMLRGEDVGNGSGGGGGSTPPPPGGGGGGGGGGDAPPPSGGGGDAGAPNAPSDAGVSRRNGKARITWIDRSDNEDEFRIERKQNGLWRGIARAAKNRTFHTDLGAPAGALLEYRVRAVRQGKASAWASTGGGGGGGGGTPPPSGGGGNGGELTSPSNASVSRVNGKARITWNDRSDNEEQFGIERKRNGVWSGIARAAENRTFHTDLGAPAGALLPYRVRALATGKTSAWAYTGGGSTPPPAGDATPAAPSNVKAVKLNGNIRITWNDRSDNEQEFRVERKVDGSWRRIARPARDRTFHTDLGAPAGRTLQYRVQAYGQGKASGWSYSGTLTR